MMGKVEEYRRTLRELDNWDSLLLRECGLPGPRGNIELARAVADEGDEELFHRYLSFDAEVAPANSPQEFLAFCGVLGLGRLVSEGKTELLGVLREWASDPRWRTREAVAMALQRLGQVDMDLLLDEMERWSRGGLLERRAAAAGLCEPILLGQPEHARRVLEILDAITASIVNEEDRRSDQFRALRKGLGYCWSVAVVAFPDQGKKMMEEWLSSDDRDVRWILKENLRKKRLERLDAEWVRQSRVRLESR
jgi:hypothetical protein